MTSAKLDAVLSRSHRLCRAALVCALLGALVGPVSASTPATAQSSCGPEGNTLVERTPWPLRRLEPSTAWPMSRGEGITVAVIDSGVSPDHPVLRDRVLPGRDFGLPDRSGHCDESGHGTIIAGIIAGRDDTGSPFTGVAPSARILPIRVLEDTGPVDDDTLPGRIGDAIRWAVDNGADVINLSLEVSRRSDLAAGVIYAWENDVVMVAAAGNVEDGQQQEAAFPAAYTEVMAVAGIDEAGSHVDTSISGGYLSVAAPGHDIEGPAPGDDGFLLEAEGGTSYAAAYVSGVAALVRAYHPGLSAEEVMRRIERTADRPPAGFDDLVGHGVVNPYRAVSTVLGTRTNPPVAPVQPSAVVEDPLAAEKRVAAAVALSGGVVALLLLLGRPLIRLGRQRGWRPGGGDQRLRTADGD